jgi:DNA invertase Pin-like site-specific DNA recombinase
MSVGSGQMTVTGIPCVVYGAKSSEDLRGSIPDQLVDCRAAVEREGGRTIVAEYTDEAFSAFKRSRGPALVDAMQHVEELAKERGTAELWAQHSDRLARGDGRSARHAVEIALWALKHDVKVRTIQDPDTFRDLLYAVVSGERNHEDSRRRGLATAAGLRRSAIRGNHLGLPPDGYRWEVELDPSGSVKKRLVIDPERRPVIEMIFRLALRGRGTAAIARALNRAGWRTKPKYRGKEPQGWTTTWVSMVLDNPRYAWLTVVKGEVVGQGCWPAYIAPRQHERLTARRRLARGPRKNGARPRRTCSTALRGVESVDAPCTLRRSTGTLTARPIAAATSALVTAPVSGDAAAHLV